MPSYDNLTKSSMKSFLPWISTIFLFGLLIFAIFWLWQRQPKPQIQTRQPATFSAQIVEVEKIQIISPKNESVINSLEANISGKTLENTHAVIFGREPTVAQTNSDGSFVTKVPLSKGLNFVGVAPVASVDIPTKWITIYADPQNENRDIAAGTVKSIFENILTIEDMDNQKKIIRVTRSTSFEFPEEEEIESSDSAFEKILLGDFAVGIGAKDGDSLIASRLEIRKDPITKNSFEFSSFKITTVSKNKFSAIDNKSKNSVEFNLNTSSKTQGASVTLTKDQNAIIIFHKDGDQKIADLVWLTRP